MVLVRGPLEGLLRFGVGSALGGVAALLLALGVGQSLPRELDPGLRAFAGIATLLLLAHLGLFGALRARWIAERQRPACFGALFGALATLAALARLPRVTHAPDGLHIGLDLGLAAVVFSGLWVGIRWSPPYRAPRSPSFWRELGRAALLALAPLILSLVMVVQLTRGSWARMIFGHTLQLSELGKQQGLVIPGELSLGLTLSAFWLLLFLGLRLLRQVPAHEPVHPPDPD